MNVPIALCACIGTGEKQYNYIKKKILYTMMLSCPLSSRREGNASTVKQVGGCDSLVSI